MCGRYSLSLDAQALVDAFSLDDVFSDYRPRYNIAPGSSAPVVAQAKGRRYLGALHWGIDAGKRGGRALINARAESVHIRPTFRDAFLRRRCLVPSDGFFEWRREPDLRRPFWFHRPGGGVMAMAGVWTRTLLPSGPRNAFAILTTAAHEIVAPIHDRMPVLLASTAWSDWLAPGTPIDALHLLVGSGAEPMEVWEVSTRVNGTTDDDRELIEAVVGPPA